MPSKALIVAALTASSLAYVHLPFDKDAAVKSRASKARRSDSRVASLPMGPIVSAGNFQPTHFNVSIGTPPQPMLWGIDTGSHLAVISGQQSTGCDTADCFDTTASSTWVSQDGDCGEGFIGGSISSDKTHNSTDTLTIAGITIEDYPVCINQAGEGNGILGLNFQDSAYPDILAKLRDGHIDRAAIALWLNDLDGDNGEIVFGGLDSSKFEGFLTQMELQSEADGSYANLRAPFTGFALTDAQGNSHPLTPPDYPGRAPGLDTGAPGIALPVDMYNALWAALGVVNSTSTGLKAVPCDLANSPATLDFTYGDSLTFETPMSTWVAEQFDEPIFLPNGTAVPACRLNIDADPGDNGNLGTPLQQFMYLVWDYENKKVAMGHARRGTVTDTPNIIPLTSGSAIPSVSSTATATGVVVTTNSGKTIQAMSQTTTVASGTTGLVYSTPLWDLGVGNPWPSTAAQAGQPTADLPTILPSPPTYPTGTGAPPLVTGGSPFPMKPFPTGTGSANRTSGMQGPYYNQTSPPAPPPPCPESTGTPPSSYNSTGMPPWIPSNSTGTPPVISNSTSYDNGTWSGSGSGASGSGAGNGTATTGSGSGSPGCDGDSSGSESSGSSSESGSSGSGSSSGSDSSGSGLPPSSSGSECGCERIAAIEAKLHRLELLLLTIGELDVDYLEGWGS